MEPIATYSEVRFDGSRTFTLFPDKIVVRGKQTLSSEFEASFSLKSLDPDPCKLWIRNRNFNSGLLIAVVSFVMCEVLAAGFHMSFATIPPLLFAVVGTSGILLMLATIRKVEFIRFKNDGGVVILDVARAGRGSAQFDSFVDALTKQIRESKGLS